MMGAIGVSFIELFGNPLAQESLAVILLRETASVVELILVVC